MFLGEFHHTLDAKGRLSLPARFRNTVTGSLVISKGMEGCLYVHPAEGFEASMDRLVGSNDFDPQVRKVRRFFAAGASEVDLDSAGRINLPQRLREHAGLAKDVTVVGSGDRIELWDTTKWDAYNDETSEHIEEYAADLVVKGFL